MSIPFDKLTYTFKQKPVLVGGKAMEYYGLRQSGKDVDFIATEEDVIALIRRYPDRVKDLWGDLGVCPYEFEIWKSINLLEYGFYRENAIEEEDYFIVSIEKLLFMKALAMNKEKYLNDVKLIVKDFTAKQSKLYPEIALKNKRLLSGIEGIVYIEKGG